MTLFLYGQSKTSSNNGILLKGVLIPKLLSNSFASCSLINFDFLLPHRAHFDNTIVLPLLVFETLGFMPSVFFCTLDDKMKLFYI